jgi:hypothetical protein
MKGKMPGFTAPRMAYKHKNMAHFIDGNAN